MSVIQLLLAIQAEKNSDQKELKKKELINFIKHNPHVSLEDERDLNNEAIQDLCGALVQVPAPIKLSLADNSLDGEAISLIASFLEKESCPLTHLDLCICDIGDEGAKQLSAAIGKNPKSILRHLDLQGNAIGEFVDLQGKTGWGVSSLLKNLKTNTSLERLDLRANTLVSDNPSQIESFMKERNASSLTDVGIRPISIVIDNEKLFEPQLPPSAVPTTIPEKVEELEIESPKVQSGSEVESQKTSESEVRIESQKATQPALSQHLAEPVRVRRISPLANVEPVSNPTLSMTGNSKRVLDILKALRGGYSDTQGLTLLKEELKGVTSLSFLNKGITDEDIENLCLVLPGTKINSLNFSENQLGTRGVVALSQILKDTNLLALSFMRCGISSEAVAILAPVLKDSKVMALDLMENNIDDRGAIALAKALRDNPALEKLHLMRNKISFNGAKAIIEALEHNNKLEFLHLGANAFGADASKLSHYLNNNTALKRLSLGFASNFVLPPSDKVKPDEAYIPSPRSYYVYKTLKRTWEAFTNTLVEYRYYIGSVFAALGVALTIGITLGSPIAVIGLISLAAFALGLLGGEIASSTFIKDEKSFSNSTAAESSNIALALKVLKNSSSAHLKQAAFKQLRFDLKTIEDLNLSNLELDDIDIINLSSVLEGSRLKKLNLSQNKITDISTLSQALEKHSIQLESLNLSDNRIGSQGAQHLAKSLPIENLKELNLSKNAIDHIGCIALAQKFTSSSEVSIQSLDLSANHIDSRSLHALATFLLDSQSLKRLNLDNNLLGGFYELKKMGDASTGFYEVNEFTPSNDAIMIAQALNENQQSALEMLYLSNNRILPEVSETIVSQFKSKPYFIEIDYFTNEGPPPMAIAVKILSNVESVPTSSPESAKTQNTPPEHSDSEDSLELGEPPISSFDNPLKNKEKNPIEECAPTPVSPENTKGYKPS